MRRPSHWSRVLVFFSFTLMSTGQASTPPTSRDAQKDALNRTTPQSSVLAFLNAVRADDIGRATEYMDLAQLPASTRASYATSAARALGDLLAEASDFDLGSVNNAPEGDLTDGLPESHELLYAARGFKVEMERKTEGNLSLWIFAPATVDSVLSATPQTDSALERRLPGWITRWRFLGTPAWRWVALAVLLPMALTIGRLIAGLLMRLLAPVCKPLDPTGACNFAGRFIGPLQAFLALALFRAGSAWIPLSALSRFYTDRVLSLATLLLMIWTGSRSLDFMVARIRLSLRARHASLSQSVLPLISRITKGILFVFAVTFTLANWGFDMTTVLAGVGIGGIAIALAAQKTVENLFGGIAIITDAPVSVGDFCRFGDRVGTVEDIGLRSTQVRTLDRTLVTIPNGEFSSMTLENFSRRDKVWFHHTLNLKKDTSPDQVRRIVALIEQILRSHPKVEVGSMPVRFVGGGAASLDVEIFAYIHTSDYDEYLRIQQDLLLPMMSATTEANENAGPPTSLVGNNRR